MMSLSHDSNEGVSDSQGSLVSNLSLDLSQDTVNQLLGAVGMSGSDGSQFTTQFESWIDDINEEEEVPGTSTISISRAIISASSVQGQCSLGSSQLTDADSYLQAPPLQPYPRLSPVQTHCQPSPESSNTHPSSFITPTGRGRSVLLSPFSENDSTTPSPPLQITTTPPPVSFSDHAPPAARPLPFLPSVSSLQTQVGLGANIPQNLPVPGEYGFKFICDQMERKVSKSTTCTYSAQTRRLYIKHAVPVTFMFAFTKPPPMTAIIRAMAIHKQPEMIAQNLVCCPKHVDDQKKKGLLFPLHFIHCKNEKSQYCEDSATKRLSVTVPYRALQERGPAPAAQYIAVYQFPCFTSDLPKGGQLVQIIFSLEHNSHLLGRCTVDIRVCSSPGRDRGSDERKAAGVDGHSADGGVALRSGRKRGLSSSMAEVMQCTLPPKQLCQGLSKKKVSLTIVTYPEIVPYINVCVNLMEQIYSVKVDPREDGTSGSAAAQELEVQMDLDSWLEKLNLTQYRSVLSSRGVNSLFQAAEVTDEELKSWGMKNAAHRKKFVDGKDYIRIQEDGGEPNRFSTSPPFSPCDELQTSHSTLSQSTMPLSQSSQLYSHKSSVPFSQPFEVLQIQVKKRVSNPEL